MMELRDVTALRVRLRAEQAVELPCLATVALRSVFGMALRDGSCVWPDRNACSGCEAATTCAYGVLFEPTGGLAPALGVTNRAPAPVVFAPETPVVDGAPVHVRRGGARADGSPATRIEA